MIGKDLGENVYNNQVICYTAAWNLECHDLDECRVNSFKALYERVKELKW